jgi:hypothetical protein
LGRVDVDGNAELITLILVESSQRPDLSSCEHVEQVSGARTVLLAGCTDHGEGIAETQRAAEAVADFSVVGFELSGQAPRGSVTAENIDRT